MTNMLKQYLHRVKTNPYMIRIKPRIYNKQKTCNQPCCEDINHDFKMWTKGWNAAILNNINRK